MRAVTFNLQHARTESGGVDLDGAATAIAGLEADIVGLQEVDHGVERSGRADQAAAIGEACAMSWSFATASRVRWFGRQGNALLVRGEVTDVERVRLPRARRGAGRSALTSQRC